jgi:hypothetical protein
LFGMIMMYSIVRYRLLQKKSPLAKVNQPLTKKKGCTGEGMSLGFWRGSGMSLGRTENSKCLNSVFETGCAFERLCTA